MSYPPGATYTVSAGDTILAAHYNTQSSDWINNNIPSSIDDTSPNAAGQQVQSDPDGTLATTLAIEIQQLRFMLAEITGETYWYTTATGGSLSALTPASITLAGSAWPSFHVGMSTAQLNVTGNDQVEFDTDAGGQLYDTNSNFNTTTFRFTPTVAGKYHFEVSLNWLLVTATDYVYCYIKKNGTAVKSHAFYTPGGNPTNKISVDLNANGSTDYFEVFAENTARDTSTINADTEYTWWTGHRCA